MTGGTWRGGCTVVIGCYRSKFFGIEVKAGKNKPTALQMKNLREIEEQGGLALVVNEDNVSHIEELLR